MSRFVLEACALLLRFELVMRVSGVRSLLQDREGA